MNQANQNLPFLRTQSADFSINNQPRQLLMTHNSSDTVRRTADSARHLSQGIRNVFRDTVFMGMQNVISSSFLNRPQLQQHQQQQQQLQEENNVAPTLSNDNNSFVVNLEDILPSSNNVEPEHISLHSNAANILNDTTDPSNNNAAEGVNAEQAFPAETVQFFKVTLKYVPFILILLAKTVYDYHQGIFIFIILFATFAHTNSAVKKETTKGQRRSLSTLSVELLYIFACFIFIHYVFADDLHNFNVVLNLVLIKTFTQPMTVWNLLWILVITDFVLKLITVTIKILLTMLPGKVIDFKKRGKVYLFIEACSQLYRSIACIQPWLFYLLLSYEGPEKIVAVFLSAFYMISKGNDLLSKMKLLKDACFKIMQNVTIGSHPSKDQIQSAGEHCPICHDEYDSPVLLQCRHIFCESCVTTWFDREQTCPLCRAKIVDDPSWRDGSTTYFIQLF